MHIDKKESIEDFAKDIPTAAYKLMDKFWPGPLTLILKSKEAGTIGIRMPDNEVALRIIGPVLGDVPQGATLRLRNSRIYKDLGYETYKAN